MTKIKKKVKSTQKETALSKFNIENIIPLKYQTGILLAIIFIIFLAYFSPMYFGGETFESGDIVTSKSASSYLDNERDDYTLWYPYIFGGMPAHAFVTGFKWYNLIWVGMTAIGALFTSLFAADYAKWTMYLLILAITTYFLIFHLTKNRLLSFWGGISTSFSSGIIMFLFIGHVTKLTGLCFYPLIFLMLLRFQERIRLRDFLILIITVHLSFQGWHVQIIFYTLFSILVFYIYYFSRFLINKHMDDATLLVKSGLVFIAAFFIALAMQSDNLTQIYQWNPYSTRGTESILDKTAGKQQQSESDFYQYATNWSFSPGEVLTFVVPSYYGFGKSVYKGPLTKNQEFEVNTYFGQMPFVDMAMYMGVIVFFLGLFSMYANWKNPYVQFLTLLVFISLMLSFGRTFPIFYDLMFNYFPFFDKFRVPSMILVILQISFPILAALGIHKIISLKKEKDINLENIIKYAALGFTGVFLIVLLLNSVFSDWFSSRIANYATFVNSSQPQLAQQFNALNAYITEMFVGDLQIAFGLLTLVFWLAYGYTKSKLSADILVLAIFVLTVFDLFRIDLRGGKYKEAANVEGLFNEPEYITYINSLNDNQPYRIFNIKQDGSLGSFRSNSIFNGYFLKHDFYGYSSIKPRSYQDYFDVVGFNNPTMLRMLNTKYIIADQPFNQPGLKTLLQKQGLVIFENTQVLPRAFFVDSVAESSAIDILNKVKSNAFDPSQIAFVSEKSFQIDKPDSSANIKFVKYLDEKIELDVNASGNNFLFLGDTYYPNGWSAFIDGSETEIYQVNHGFRGVIIPEGNHKVEFIYAPTSFTVSKYMVLILSWLSVIGVVLIIIIEKKKNINS